MINKIIIAIDGHSSTGKSTLAKMVAKELKYKHINTGAMYRAVTWLILVHSIEPNNQIEIKNITFDVGFKSHYTNALKAINFFNANFSFYFQRLNLLFSLKKESSGFLNRTNLNYSQISEAVFNYSFFVILQLLLSNSIFTS